MTSFIYNKFKEYCGDDTIDLDNDTFKCALLTSSHVPSAGYALFGDVSSNEVSGSGYTAGGKNLTNITWGETDGISTFDADNIIWTDATFTARYAVIYDDTTTSPPDVLVCMYDLEEDNFVNNGTFTLTFNSVGIIRIL